jgi:hypothetical protein
MQATGGLLPGPDAHLGGPTFEQWLDEHDRKGHTLGRSVTSATRHR